MDGCPKLLQHGNGLAQNVMAEIPQFLLSGYKLVTDLYYGRYCGQALVEDQESALTKTVKNEFYKVVLQWTYCQWFWFRIN